MAIQDMDICLNISSGTSAGEATKVQRSKSAFFKPHVKRLVKKAKRDLKKNNNETDEKSSKSTVSPTKIGLKNQRVKQKSLGAIVAKNVVRSKIVNANNARINKLEKKTSGNVSNQLSTTASQKTPFQKQKGKPLVSFSEPTKENELKTILAKTRNRNEDKPKKSLADLFSKSSESKDVNAKLLPEVPKTNSSTEKTFEKFPHARNVIESESGGSSFNRKEHWNQNRNQNRNRTKDNARFEDRQEKSYAKPSGKISSLFGNNPEVPNIGQRLVKPVNETVFSKTTFEDLGIHSYSISNLEQNMGITKATTVQQKAIPVILSGKNVLIRSQTGSGKTLAYALPIVETLQRIRPKLMRNSGLRALVVVPTRELALQTYECFLKLVKPFTWIVPGYLVGGEKRKAEKARLRRGCTILIATPGRLLDHIEHTESLKLNEVKCFVLDEADRMLDMGYEKDISGIVEALKKQTGAESEKCSYDPLALVRSRGTKVVDDAEEKMRESAISGAVEEKAEEHSKKEETEASDESKEILNQQEYHSGTDSDEGDQEFLIRTKKTKKKIPPQRKSQNEETPLNKTDENNRAGTSSRQTVLLSATLTAAVEKLAGLTMTDPVFVDAAQDNLNQVGGNLSETNEDLVVPQGVNQSYVVTPAKLRMVTLSAYIAGKCQVAGEHKILVFMATQDMIDYHADILSTVLGKPRDEDDEDSDALVDVEFFKLHGSMSQKERTEVFKTFRKARSGVLLCTDVAARGLDMPKVDTVVQYTGPLSARDYVHRIGRTGRAGSSGASIIFLTPSEIDFVRILESRRIRIKQENMNDILDKLMGPLSKHHTVEATATALQNEFENLVIEDKKFHSKACKAYVSWIRFYASYPRDMREVFNRKDLHLGHYAKSFALRDPPQKIGGIGKTLRDNESSKPRHNNRLSRERPAKQPQKRQRDAAGSQKPGLLKKSRMLNVSEYASGLESIKKTNKK
ncbi:probable ATP-dependent RNA helicase CG8611 [Venturia canescens]|uniref:probable ATP-dependent RNA helicase CG8611 n=1 Tax=Venturia canescens TaxID=32260 RepID=UPI001C9D3E51|nr:probable ATP-dependent RNA helicase CG8611 [Venturia canescens]